jgi:hypothetical protein
MNNSISYKIIPEKKLVLEYFCGTLTWKDIVNNKKKLVLEKEYNPTYNIIDDVRDAFATFTEEGINEFVKLLNTHKGLYGNRRSAILTNTPNQIVNSVMLDSLKKDLPINFKTVSTFIEAAKWVKVAHTDFELIEYYLSELKKFHY